MLFRSDATGDEEAAGEQSDGSIEWRYAAAMYAAYTTLVDRWFGRLRGKLQESPGWSDALLIVTAASGQSLGEHGAIEDETPRLRSELAQTPLWIRVPGSDQGGTRRQDVVQAIDLAPTLLDWFCAPGTDLDSKAGCSLLPCVGNEQYPRRDHVILGNGRSEWGLRTPEFFYVESGDRDLDSQAPPHLFEKPADRWDQSDVLSQYPDVAEELRSTLRSQIDALTTRGGDMGWTD